MTGEKSMKELLGWDSQDMLDAVNRAVFEAVKRHKERGESIVIWEDGQVKTLPADEIDLSVYQVPDEPEK